MKDQPKQRTYRESKFYPDKRSERPLIDGTVARGFLREDEALYSGKVNGQLVKEFPFEVTPQVLARGRERYNIYCIVCHDAAGTGKGMIVRRGFKAPPTFHSDRLREMPVGHFYDVITNGFATMYDYSAQISPWDRWAIVAYIRALQLSQNARISDAPVNAQQQFEKVIAASRAGAQRLAANPAAEMPSAAAEADRQMLEKKE